MTEVLFISFFLGFWSLVSIFLKKKINNIEFFFQKILLFTLIFPIIFLIKSYSIAFNVNNFLYLKIFIILFAIYGAYSFAKAKSFKNNFELNKIKYKDKYNLLIYIFLFSYTIISIFFYPSDEDSIRYHLPIAEKIINNTFYENIWLDYTVIGPNEFLSAFGLLFNFENFISLSNIIYIIFIYKINNLIKINFKLKYSNLNFLLFISAPYFVSLLSSQKLYILPTFIVTYSLIYLFFFKKVNLMNYYLLSFLNIFALASKATFLPYVALFFIWSFLKLKNKYRIIYFIVSFLFFLLLFVSLFLIKYKIFNEPFLPYYVFFEDNKYWFNDFYFYLTNFQLDFTDRFDSSIIKILFIPIKLVIPITSAEIFKVFGLGMLMIFSIKFKKNKRLLILFILFFLSVLILHNYQIRWFLPFFLLIVIFGEINNNFLKKAFIFQSFLLSLFVFTISVFILVGEMLPSVKNFNKSKIINTFEINKEIELITKNKKILTNVNAFYYFKNSIPIYYPKIVKKFDANYYFKQSKKIDYVLWYDRRISFENFLKENNICKSFEELKKYDIYTRRFTIFSKPKKIILYKKNC